MAQRSPSSERSQVSNLPPLVASLGILTVLYLSAHRPLTLFFEQGRGGVSELLLLLCGAMLGAILAAVVRCLLEPAALRAYTLFMVIFFLLALCVSALLVFLRPYGEEPMWFSVVLFLFPQLIGVLFAIPGVVVHLLTLHFLARRR